MIYKKDLPELMRRYKPFDFGLIAKSHTVVLIVTSHEVLKIITLIPKIPNYIKLVIIFIMTHSSTITTNV